MATFERASLTSIRENVDAREAAKLYGLKLNRSDMALCPFHAERTPSFKVYRDHFYCFGCQAHGDVISLTMRLTGLDFVHAVERLEEDFGIEPIPRSGTKPFPRYERSAVYRSDSDRFWHEYDLWYDGLKEMAERSAPTPDGGGNMTEYLQATSMLDYLDYLRESIWHTNDEKTKSTLILTGLAYFAKLKKYRQDVAGAAEARRKEVLGI